MTASSSGVLAGRLALVTGASRGLGAAVAKRFAREGAHLILTARTVGGLEETDDAIRAAGGTATIVPLDLLEGDKIDQLGAAIFERFGKLDILVGNAGMLGDLSPVAHVTPKQWDQVFSLNVTANYRLIRSLDPMLRASTAGRAIFVTSGGVRSPSAYWGAYSASKAALETMITCYAEETPKTPLRVNMIDPGVVRTSMRAQAFPGEDPNRHPLPDTITETFLELASESCTRHGEIVQGQRSASAA